MNTIRIALRRTVTMTQQVYLEIPAIDYSAESHEAARRLAADYGRAAAAAGQSLDWKTVAESEVYGQIVAAPEDIPF